MKINTLATVRREFLAAAFIIGGVFLLCSGDLWSGLALFSAGVILAF